MTAIRPIRETEAEEFLGVLAAGFSVDADRVYNAFFEEPFFDLDRKWALFEGSRIVSILTTTPLEFGWGRAAGIAGVVTLESRRGEGLATRLLERVVREGERSGEAGFLLFAQRPELYERAGFVALDRVIRAPLDPDLAAGPGPVLSFEEVRERYDRWAAADPDRLRRDERRWEWWKWHYRTGGTLGSGYVTVEQGYLKEAIYAGPLPASVPVPTGTEWLGLTQMADLLGLAFTSATVDFTLMGRGIPRVPQFWMTDQF